MGCWWEKNDDVRQEICTNPFRVADADQKFVCGNQETTRPDNLHQRAYEMLITPLVCRRTPLLPTLVVETTLCFVLLTRWKQEVLVSGNCRGQCPAEEGWPSIFPFPISTYTLPPSLSTIDSRRQRPQPAWVTTKPNPTERPRKAPNPSLFGFAIRCVCAFVFDSSRSCDPTDWARGNHVDRCVACWEGCVKRGQCCIVPIFRWGTCKHLFLVANDGVVFIRTLTWHVVSLVIVFEPCL